MRNAALEPLLLDRDMQSRGGLGSRASGRETAGGRAGSSSDRASGETSTERARAGSGGAAGDKVVFVNDVFFCTQHLLRLVMHDQAGRGGGGAGGVRKGMGE